MSTLTILGRNIRLYPRLFVIAVLIYLATAAGVGVPLGMKAHSFPTGLISGIAALVVVLLADYLAFVVIRRNPVLYGRFQYAADVLVNGVPQQQTGENEECYCDNDEDAEIGDANNEARLDHEDDAAKGL